MASSKACVGGLETLTCKARATKRFQIIDASLVVVPIQRNGRDENEQIKGGETPEAWADKPAKRRQKDTDARWTKKRQGSLWLQEPRQHRLRKHKLIRRYGVTGASVHDSQAVEGIEKRYETR